MVQISRPTVRCPKVAGSVSMYPPVRCVAASKQVGGPGLGGVVCQGNCLPNAVACEVQAQEAAVDYTQEVVQAAEVKVADAGDSGIAYSAKRQ